MSKNNYDQFNLPPAGPNLCDFYGQYIGFGGGGPTGVPIISVGNSALYTTTSQELERTPGSAGNVDKFTFSAWVYFTQPTTSSSTPIFGAINGSANQHRLLKTNTGQLQHDLYLSNSFVGRITTTQLLRDQAWYHIVAVYDSGNSVADNRMMFYLNGQRITNLGTKTYPSQNLDGLICGAHLHQLGLHDGLSLSLDGYMAEAVLLDGTVAGPSSFGQYDSTGTFWTPKSSIDIKALTFGTTGFYLDNASNAQTDANGTNSWTNTNTVVTSSHTCTNIHNLWNPLETLYNGGTFTNGNRTVQTSDGTFSPVQSTIGVKNGKWYCEVLATATSNAVNYMVGITKGKSTSNAKQIGSMANDVGYSAQTGKQFFNATSGSGGATYGSNVTWTTNDVIGIALDLDSSPATVTFLKNGASSGAIDISSLDLTTPYFIACTHYDNSSNGTFLLRTVSDDWTQTPPAGHKAITTTEIAAATTRTKSDLSEYFESIVYEGNGFGQRVGRLLPFTNSFTVGNSALFNGTDNSLSRNQVAGTSAGEVWTFSAWIKKCESKNTVYVNWSDDSAQGQLGFDASGQFYLYDGATVVGLTSKDFADEAQWSHYHVAYNTGESGTDKVKLTINGVLETNWATDNRSSADAFQGVGINGEPMIIGNNASAGGDAISLNGYMAQVVFLDGTASAASNFGQLDTSTGRWIPSDLSSFSFGSGNNTVFLDFADSDALGDDESGQGHDFTNNNTVVQTADSPTTNFGTLQHNQLNTTEILSNGNRSGRGGAANEYWILPSGLRMTTEKIFVAMRMDDGADGSSQVNVSFGCQPPNANIDGPNVGPVTDSYAGIDRQGGAFRVFNNQYDDAPGSGVSESHTISAADTDVITMAVDPSDPHNGKVWFGVYDTSEDSHQYIPNIVGGTAGDPAQGTLPTIDGINFKGDTNPLGEWRIFTGGYRNNAASTILLDSADIPITIPSGFLEYKQSNIKKGRTIATGASADEITPSYTTAWNWIKNRDAADSHMMFDRVRGVGKDLHTDSSAVEATDANTMHRFLRGGVQVGNDVQVNTHAESYVSWQWYMETTGSGTSNTDGTINTTATLVDTNIGLSISQFTGTGANATIGHGLGVVPQMYWVKGIDGGDHFYVYHANNTAAPETDALLLNGTGATFDDATLWNDTAPTSSLISLGSNTGVNQDGKKYLAMAFAPSQFNAIGSYVGNGNADGTFIPTTNSLGIPITPSWFMAKSTGAGQDWRIVDDSRSRFNVNSLHLRANTTAADVSETNLDIDTGGIKIRTSSGGWNTNGTTYIYLAFGTPIIDTSGRIITGR